MTEIVSGLTGASHELQEISLGINPASAGLGPALNTLARRSAVPVRLHVAIDRRLPESLEVTAYYPESLEVTAYHVVAEALANTAKHAQADQATVRAHTTDGGLSLSICDDGIGGADMRKGPGSSASRTASRP